MSRILHPWWLVGLTLLALWGAGCTGTGSGRQAASSESPRPAGDSGFERLFASEGRPAGWRVRSWNDLSREGPPGAAWVVSDGVLRPTGSRGTWLVSEREYSDFVLEFDFRLGRGGNSGVGLRLPAAGEPATEGFEVQLVDPAYFGEGYEASVSESSGAILGVTTGRPDVFRPGDWNHCRIVCRGTRIAIEFNGLPVVDVGVEGPALTPGRGRPLSERPHRGRLGFQDISRGRAAVEFRGLRLREGG